MLRFSQNIPSINRVEEPIVLIGLIRKSAVIDKDVTRPAVSFGLGCDLNWLSQWRVGGIVINGRANRENGPVNAQEAMTGDQEGGHQKCSSANGEHK